MVGASFLVAAELLWNMLSVDSDEVDTKRAVFVSSKSNHTQDERGNLKAVNFVIRAPCKIFILLIVFCLALSFLLNVLVFRKAGEFAASTI